MSRPEEESVAVDIAIEVEGSDKIDKRKMEEEAVPVKGKNANSDSEDETEATIGNKSETSVIERKARQKAKEEMAIKRWNKKTKEGYEPSKKPKQQHVRVGVGVLVRDSNRKAAVFAGIRKGSHGAGSLALPGGHLEMFESWEECAKREVKEEMNLDLKLEEIEFAHVTNDPMLSEDKHYVTIFMMAKSSGVPENMEPEKCEGWKSYTMDELKDIYAKGETKLFGPLNRLVCDTPRCVEMFLSEESRGVI